MLMATALYSQGCFVDSDGFVRDVAAPGPGMSCKVDGNKVLLLGSFEAGDGAEVIDECTYYPTLDALKAIGFMPGTDGRAVRIG
ncbi:hypothetical protein WL71_24455 [Burkholderia ubonensis]|uniref:Uncharacterized protein n=2 Tax=Burkholderia ubonensis TaxID=101571 RepID=A0A107FMN7_9BURK|nr:hypothetical protein WL71_24455 [Burkholderia ubonensis]KWD87566.1 hypothetical protein WL70_09280 [Burkholderia ubonensis]KWD89709.1 hypothetical protein WL72_32705 [Burkholderia ubonensis]KWD96330.1 hypothetical protein WL73_23015 [Burkholderia ubonensis]